jgi:TPR repeat protein
MNRRTSAALLPLFALALFACKERSSGVAPSESPYASASAPPPVQVVTELGACDDVGVCERECDGGSGDRCRRLGVAYEFGKGVDKDVARSTAMYERACDLGNALGCEAAGRMYEFHAQPHDLAKAAALYERSCDKGWQGGCANWAICLENGRGVAKDLTKARTLYAGACKAGAGLACERLKVLGDD